MSVELVNSLLQAQQAKSQYGNIADTVTYSYGDIKDLQDYYAQDPNSILGQLDTGSFSRLLQAQGGIGDYHLGTNPGFIKNASNKVDRFFRKTGINAAGSAVGGGIGAGIDYLTGDETGSAEATGREIGSGLGRGVAQVGAFVGGLAAAPATGGASLALSGAALADGFADGYTATDSIGTGLLNAASIGIAPGVGKIGANIGIKTLGRVGGQRALQGAGFKQAAKRVIATEVGQEAAFFGQDAAVQLLQGENPFSYDNMVANIVGNVAMAPLAVKGMVQGAGKIDSTPGTFEGIKEAYGVRTKIKTEPVQPIIEKDTEILFLPYREGRQAPVNDLGNDGSVIHASMSPERVALYNTIVRANNAFLDKYVPDSTQRKALLDLSEASLGTKDDIIDGAVLTKPIDSMEDIVKVNKLYNEALTQMSDQLSKSYDSLEDTRASLDSLNSAKQRKQDLVTQLENSKNPAKSKRVKKQIKKLDDVIKTAEEQYKATSSKIKEQQSQLQDFRKLELGSDIELDQARVVGLKGLESFDKPQNTGRRVPKSVGGSKPTDSRRGQQSRFKFIGAEELYAMYDLNVELGDSPNQAMLRAGEQLKAQTKDMIRTGGEITGQTKAEQVASVLGRTFDYLGVNKELKTVWMAKTLDIVEQLPLDPRVKFKSVDEIDSAYFEGHAKEAFMGLYTLDDTRTVGLNTRLKKHGTDLDAFQAASTLIHEAIHAVTHKIDSDFDLGIDNSRVTALRDAREYAQSLTKEERLDIISRFYDERIHADLRFLDRRGNNSIQGWKEYAAETPEEFLTEFAMLTALSGHSPKKSKGLQEAFRHLPEPMKRFLRAVYKTASELTKMVKSVLPKEQHGKFEQFEKDINSILAPDKVEIDAKQALVDLTKPIELDETNTTLQGVQFKKTGSNAIDKWLNKGEEYKGATSFTKAFGSLQQLLNTPKFLQQFPTGRQVIDVLTRSGGEIKTKMNAMLSSEMVRVDHGELRQLSSMADKDLTKDQIFRKSARTRYDNHQPLRVALSNAMRVLNDSVADGKLDLTWDSPAIQKELSGLSQADKDVAKLLYESRLEGSREAAGLVKLGFAEETIFLTAQILQKHGLSNDQSVTLARQSVNSMLLDQPLPGQLLGMGKTGDMVSQFLDSQREITRQAFSDLDKPFFSEMRTGKFNLRIDKRDGRKPMLIPANTKGEVKAWKTKIKQEGWELVSTKLQNEMEFSEFDVIPSSILQKTINMAEQRLVAYEKMTGDIVDETFRSGQNSVISGLRDELKDRKTFLAQRKFADGREYLDMVTTQDGYYQAVAASVTKRVNRAKVAFLLSSPEWQGDLSLQQKLKEFTNNLLNKQQVSFTTFNKMVTVSKMGFGVSGALVDSTQNITMGIPALMADTSLGTAVKYVAQGYKEAFKPSKDMDPEYREILTKAHNEGHLLTGAAFEEAFSTADVDAYNVARAAEGRTLVNVEEALTSKQFMWYKTTELVKKWGQKLGSASLTPTKISAQINNKTTLYAAYKVGKDLGLKGSQLYDYALNKMQTVNIQGGRAASSAVKLTGSPKLNGFIESGTLLTKFPVAYLTSMVENYQSALKSSGLSPQARKKSKQIFATQLGISMGFSGAMGGLGIGTISALGSLLSGGSINIEQSIQENLAELTHPGFADVLMNGILNQTGIDFASRFKLGGVGGLSDYNGFESKDVFHAGGSFIESLLMLPEQLRSGEFSKLEIIPPSLRKMYSSIADEGKVYNKSGELVMDLDGIDRFTYAVGFRPTSLSSKQKQLSMLKDVDRVQSRRSQRERIEYADEVLKGDFRRVKPLIDKLIQPELEQYIASGLTGDKLKQVKDSLYKREAKKFISTALDRTYETDIFDRGSAATASQRARLQKTFGRHRTPRALQEQRKEQELQLLSKATGKPIDRRSQTLRMFKMIDNILLENPGLTRGQARKLARERLSGTARSGSFIEPDFR